MGQFDNFKSIAMLFIGASLVSFGIIAFLNIEVQNRANQGVKIRHENFLKVLGKKIIQIISTLRERNSYRRSLLYHLFVPENTTKTALRKLQHFTEDSNNDDSAVGQHYKSTHHRLRHEKKIKRIAELFLRERNNSVFPANAFNLENKYKFNANNNFIPLSNNASNNWTTIDDSIDSSHKESLKRELEFQQHCYSANDVLKIIGVTCLVNFIFWFLIILSVNILTRNQKMWNFNSSEFLTTVNSELECELYQSHYKKEEDFHTLNHQTFLKDYLSLITIETEGDNSDNVP